MYLNYFGLNELPFSISPNPDYLYMSDRHKEALAHLSFGLGDTGGFVLLTGEVGTGKTTVSRALLSKMPENTDVAMVLNPSLDSRELLASVCDGFNISYPEHYPSLKELTDCLREFLLAQEERGRASLLLVDEAQHLSTDSLEQLRMLTNIETNTRKLLRVVLIGQPELQQMLKQPMLRQLAQRITARYHLLPLTAGEVFQYIQYRLMVAGCERPLFSKRVARQVFKATQGIPRLINLLCDRALLASYASSQVQVSSKALKQAQHETGLVRSKPKWPWALAGAGCGLTLFISAGLWLSQQPVSQPPIADTAPKVSDSMQLQQQAELELALQVAQQQQDYQQWLEQWQALRRSQSEPRLARQNLLQAWGYQVPVHQASCSLIGALSLRCLDLSGGFSQLKQVNLPAMLELEQAGERFYAVVRKIEQGYLLWLGEQQMTVSEAWLAERWLNGQFQVLWQAPAGFHSNLKPGSQGQAVRWLGNSLALLQGETRRDPLVYDGQLSQQVERFQRENGLNADGIAGVFTLLELNQQLYPEHPKLQEYQ